MNNIELSVILCTYNRDTKIKTVLDDFKNQTFLDKEIKWELIVVDNNSVDNTKKAVHDFAANCNFIIRYIFEPRQGKSYALNSGVAAASAELLAFTDDDVIIDKNWLSSIYNAFCDFPNYNCFGGKVLPILDNPPPEWLSATDPQFPMMGGPIVSHDRGNQIKEYDSTMYVPIGSNMFVRKFIFEKYGGYSTNLGFYSPEALIYGEDVEIMFRCKNNGESILYFPEALIYHPAPVERIRKSYFKKFHWGAGRGHARWASVPSGTIRYFNIPRYMIRTFIINLIKWLIVLPSPKVYKRFHYQMLFTYHLGQFFEFYIDGD